MTKLTKPPTLEITPPRKGTKQEKLVALLCRKTGATLAQISERLGWQRHTSSAAMTGLKKRGYKIERVSEEGKTSRYIIRAPVTT